MPGLLREITCPGPVLVRSTPFMGLRDIVGALVLIALGDAKMKDPLSRLLWASLQDFRDLLAGILIFT